MKSNDFNPPSATQTLVHRMPVYTNVTHFNSLLNVSINGYLPDPEPTMCTTDLYLWLDSSDPQRFQTDREILESAIDLSQSCLTKTQRGEFYDILEEYKDAFSLHDEIGLAPNMQINLELLDKSPFFIQPFSVKEDMKAKINKVISRFVTLGILKKGLSGFSSPAFSILHKNNAIPRVVAAF